MTCPKCKNEWPEDTLVCDVCHTVLKVKEKPKPPPQKERTPEEKAALRRMAESMKAEDFIKKDAGPLFKLEEFYVPAAVGFVVAFYWCWDFRADVPWQDKYNRIEKYVELGILGLVNLAFHEGGHPIFGILFAPFGRFNDDFMRPAGGTLMQLLVPAVCLAKFYKERARASVLCATYWLGTNFLGSAIYAQDAKTLALPLITGNTGAEYGLHDWMNMFDYWHIDRGWGVTIGQMQFFIGWMLVTIPVVFGAKGLWSMWFAKPVVND